jgi:toxin-antitoxin system PIN domain toxin
LSFAIDANILLYASDGDSPFHQPAIAFLERCARGPELVNVPWPTVMAYLRIATHPTIFERPLSPGEAIANVEALISRPHVRVLSESEGFWSVFREVTGTVITRGNLVPDAHIASLLRQHGIRELYTRDRDFRKFDFLRICDPFA